jgi:hypothetical protein
MSGAGDSVTLLAERKGKVSLLFSEEDSLFRKELIVSIHEGGINGRGCLQFTDRPGYWLGLWEGGVQEGYHLWIDFDEGGEVLLEVHEFRRGIDVRTLVNVEQYSTLPEVIEWIASKPSIQAYVDGKKASISSRLDAEALAQMLESSTAPYVLEIVLESGATVRSGVNIDNSPEVRKLSLGDIIEAFARATTDEGVQRFQIIDGYISERLRDTNQALVAKVLKQLFPKPLRYKVTKPEGASIRQQLNNDASEVCMCECGSTLEVVELRVVADPKGERRELRVNPLSSQSPGWVRDEDLVLASKLLPTDLQAELSRKTQVRALREALRAAPKVSTAASVRRGTGSMKFSTENQFLLCGGHPDMSVSPDCTSVTMTSDNTRALVLGSKGFSKGVHYW